MYSYRETCEDGTAAKTDAPKDGARQKDPASAFMSPQNFCIVHNVRKCLRRVIHPLITYRHGVGRKALI